MSRSPCRSRCRRCRSSSVLSECAETKLRSQPAIWRGGLFTQETGCNLGINPTRSDAGRAIVMLSDTRVRMIEQGAGKVRQDSDPDSLKGSLSYEIAERHFGNWSACGRRDPQSVGTRPRSKQNRSRVSQIKFDEAIEAVGDAAFILSAIFGSDAWQSDPPTPVNRLEGRPDL